jgi:hypothetical protein
VVLGVRLLSVAFSVVAELPVAGEVDPATEVAPEQFDREDEVL